MFSTFSDSRDEPDFVAVFAGRIQFFLNVMVSFCVTCSPKVTLLESSVVRIIDFCIVYDRNAIKVSNVSPG